MRVIVVRNDRLGDFMLAWPAVQMLARNLPGVDVCLLARDYTLPMARLCPGVSDVFCDPGLGGELANARALARLLRPERFEAALALFSRFDTALGLALARIPRRVAPATKAAQIFYTQRLRQRRSRSLRPEWLYNVELAEFFLAALGVDSPVRPASPYLSFPAEAVRRTRAGLAARLGFDPERPLVLLHPGHGGSSPTLPPSGFARIGQELADAGAELVLSQGPGDEAAVAAVAGALGGVPHHVYVSTEGLDAYARTVAAADLFVAGSTGPLHVAGALDVPTAAFYPSRRSASAVRWQTLNSEDRRLAFMPPAGAAEDDFAAIDLGDASARIRSLLERVVRRRERAPTDPRT